MDRSPWGKEGRKRKVISALSTSAAILNIFHTNTNKNNTSHLPSLSMRKASLHGSDSLWNYRASKGRKHALSALCLSVSTFALILLSALNQIHLFRALSTDAARGITWETPLKKAKPVLEGGGFWSKSLSLDGTAGCRAPGTPGELGRQAYAFASILLPSASAPMWLVHPMGSSSAHFRKSEDFLSLWLWWSGLAWNNFAS